MVFHPSVGCSLAYSWCIPFLGPILAKVSSHTWSRTFALPLLPSSSMMSPRSNSGCTSVPGPLTSSAGSKGVTCSKKHRVFPLDRVMVFCPPFFTSMNTFFTGPSSGASTRRGSTSKGDLLSLEVKLWRQLTAVCPSSRAASPGASWTRELVTNWTLRACSWSPKAIKGHAPGRLDLSVHPELGPRVVNSPLVAAAYDVGAYHEGYFGIVLRVHHHKDWCPVHLLWTSNAVLHP